MISTGFAFGEQLIQLINNWPPGQNSGTGTTPPPEPSPADISVELPSMDAQVEASVELSDENSNYDFNTIYTHQPPHQITESVDEGRYTYDITVTYYTNTAASSAQYSAGADTANCPGGTKVDGTDQVSISDGDRFTIYTDCQTATLQELN